MALLKTEIMKTFLNAEVIVHKPVGNRELLPYGLGQFQYLAIICLPPGGFIHLELQLRLPFQKRSIKCSLIGEI